MQKVVLITGSSSGFGKGLALTFARNGFITYATMRNVKSDGGKDLHALKKTENLPLHILPLDVRSEKSIKRAVTTIVNRHKRIDILINNAGYGYLSAIEDAPIEDVRALHDTNVLGTLRMVQAVAPLMRKHQSGTVVNFSSINGIVPFPLFSLYSATKFAIETLTEGLRFELGTFGIKVCMVEPGSYLTSFSKNRQQPKAVSNNRSPYKVLYKQFFERYKKTHSAQHKVASKVADPQEVINAVYKLATSDNPALRTIIGADAWKNLSIRKLLPYTVWEWILHKLYRW